MRASEDGVDNPYNAHQGRRQKQHRAQDAEAQLHGPCPCQHAPQQDYNDGIKHEAQQLQRDGSEPAVDEVEAKVGRPPNVGDGQVGPQRKDECADDGVEHDDARPAEPVPDVVEDAAPGVVVFQGGQWEPPSAACREDFISNENDDEKRLSLKRRCRNSVSKKTTYSLQ